MTESRPEAAFAAPLWARGPHRQTLLARVLRSSEGPSMTRERLQTPDGDFLDVDWGSDLGGAAPVVLVLHGLEGSSRRRYVRSACRELLSRGVRPVAMNFRGCSGEPNRALRFYHSGETSDPTWLLGIVRERHPGRSVGALGFSLGGNALLKLMGERPDGGTGVVDAAAVMSVPFDLGAGCTELERTPMGRMYSAYFLRSLRSKVAAKRSRLEQAVDVSSALRVKTIRAFDDVVTAPLNGFSSADDYYERCSSNRFVASIRVPTLILHASDDPFLPRGSVPVREVAANPRVDLDLQERGGHVGFVAGTPRTPFFWGDQRVAAFLASALESEAPGGA